MVQDKQERTISTPKKKPPTGKEFFTHGHCTEEHEISPSNSTTMSIGLMNRHDSIMNMTFPNRVMKKNSKLCRDFEFWCGFLMVLTHLFDHFFFTKCH